MNKQVYYQSVTFDIMFLQKFQHINLYAIQRNEKIKNQCTRIYIILWFLLFYHKKLFRYCLTTNVNFPVTGRPRKLISLLFTYVNFPVSSRPRKSSSLLFNN